MSENISDNNELTALCAAVKELIEQRKYSECNQLIIDRMAKHPHAPEPHNLFGILLEKEGDHVTAMKHFRAALALDLTYIPARCNLDRYGSFFPAGQIAYDETDCPKEQEKDKYKIEYDERGIGHVVRR
jgi:hypothetical protein